MTFSPNAHGTRRQDSNDSIFLSLTETRGKKGCTWHVAYFAVYPVLPSCSANGARGGMSGLAPRVAGR